MKKILFLTGLIFTIMITPMAVYAFTTSYIAVDEGISPTTEWANHFEDPIEYLTTAAINLRPSPSTGQARIALVPAGSRVQVVDYSCEEWYAVVFDGIFGYMFSDFLTPIIPNDALNAPINRTTGISSSVEMLNWWDEARHVVVTGRAFTVIDVRTGITWQMSSFSNGNHADVEPLTSADTAAMREAFGGRWTWDPRPVLVVINGRTLAASINGMPHGGSTIAGNNFNGHVCLHFQGSRTHNGNRSHERDHQNAIMEAFNTAASW